MSRYRALAEFLKKQRGASVQLDFGAIEHLIGELPQSARERAAWWANDPTAPHADAWLAAGWEVDTVDMLSDVVTFRRIAQP